VPTKHKILCRCVCGGEYKVRVPDILAGGSLQCRVCSDKAAGAKKRTPREELIRRSILATKRLKEIRAANWGPYWDKFGVRCVQQIRGVAARARSRCTNKNDPSYANYGGRGIQCMFPTTEIMTKWLLDNLGPKPTNKHSIDRIDNNGHYEPGNIRWASCLEQARNKRQYKRTVQGEQIRFILSQRQDISYECARIWLKQKLPVAQILNRSKYVKTCI